MASKETINARFQQQLKDLSKCCVCKETFTDPRILPCVHTFCMKCIENVGSKSNKKSGQNMPCPLCNREFTIPLDGFSGIQKNFFLARQTEIGRSVSHSSSSNLCEVCIEDCNDPSAATQIPAADMYCTVCCIKLCNNCLKIHRKSKLTTSHRLENVDNQSVTGQNKSKLNVEFCKEHEGELLQLYCSDCKKVVCSFCYIESHQSHNWSYADKAAEEFRETIKARIQSLALKNQGLQKKKEEASKAMLDMIANIENLKVEINQRKALLRETIDKDAELLLVEVEALRTKQLRMIETEEEETEMQIANEEYYSLYCQEITTKGSAEDICREETQLNKRAIELQEAKESICQRNFQLSRAVLTVSNMNRFLKDDGRNIIGKIEDEEIKSKATMGHTQETAHPGMRVKEIQSKSDDHIYVGSAAATHAVEEAIKRDAHTNLLVEHKTIDKPLKVKNGHGGNTIEASKLFQIAGASATRKQPFCAVLTKCDLITGMAIIDNELFIATAVNAVIEVYDSVAFTLKRSWKLPGSCCPGDMVACPKLKCLFIFDATDCGNLTGKINRVDSMGSLLSAWFSGNLNVRLCVTSDSNVIVLYLNENKLKEYSPVRQNKLLHQVTLPSHSRYVVKLPTGNFLVSRGGVSPGIYEINKAGEEINSFKGNIGSWFKPIKWPEQLVIDDQGSVIVVDRGNKRVLSFNSMLIFQKVLISMETGSFDPLTMVLDQPTCRFFLTVDDKVEGSFKIFSGSY